MKDNKNKYVPLGAHLDYDTPPIKPTYCPVYIEAPKEVQVESNHFKQTYEPQNLF